MAAESYYASVSPRPYPHAADLTAVLARLDTATLETVAAAAIDILDERAGDPDLEDDDPAGDALDEHGEHPSDDGCTILAIKPIWGTDQTAGPVNGRAAIAAHLEEDEARNGSAVGWAVAA